MVKRVVAPESHQGAVEDPSGGDTVDIPVETEEEYVPCFFRYITPITRVAAILCVIGLWCIVPALFNTDKDYGKAHWYLIGLAITITIFELLWIFDSCAAKFKDDGCCCAFWKILIWADNWKKSILYISLSVPCFIDDVIRTETILAGVMVLVVALLYFLRSFKKSACVKRKQRSTAFIKTASVKTRLVSHEMQDTSPQYTPPHTTQPQPQPKLITQPTPAAQPDIESQSEEDEQS